eukprot:scaffold30_cov416-Prasinococcus_capsulatus_cf.AAC.18
MRQRRQLALAQPERFLSRHNVLRCSCLQICLCGLLITVSNIGTAVLLLHYAQAPLRELATTSRLNLPHAKTGFLTHATVGSKSIAADAFGCSCSACAGPSDFMPSIHYSFLNKDGYRGQQGWTPATNSTIRNSSMETRECKVLIVTGGFRGVTPDGIVANAMYSLALQIEEQQQRQARKCNVTVLLVSDILQPRAAIWQDYFADRFEHVQFRTLPQSEHHLYGTVSMQLSYRVWHWMATREASGYRAYDVVHFHDSIGLAFYPILARKTGVGLRNSLLLVHCFGVSQLTDVLKRMTPTSTQALARYFMEAKSIEGADVVVVYSRWMLRALTKVGVKFSASTKIEFLPELDLLLHLSTNFSVGNPRQGNRITTTENASWIPTGTSHRKNQQPLGMRGSQSHYYDYDFGGTVDVHPEMKSAGDPKFGFAKRSSVITLGYFSALESISGLEVSCSAFELILEDTPTRVQLYFVGSNGGVTTKKFASGQEFVQVTLRIP